MFPAKVCFRVRGGHVNVEGVALNTQSFAVVFNKLTIGFAFRADVVVDGHNVKIWAWQVMGKCV